MAVITDASYDRLLDKMNDAREELEDLIEKMRAKCDSKRVHELRTVNVMLGNAIRNVHVSYGQVK